MRKPRILHLLSSAHYGGTEMMTWTLLNHMSDRFENELCFFLEDGPFVEKYRRQGFYVSVLNWSPVRTLQVALQLFSLLRSRQYDVITVYGYKANMLARWVAWFARVKRYVTAQRSVDLDRRPWHSWLDRVTSPMVDLYVSNSAAAASLLVSRERVPQTKVLTIPNGIDSARFQVEENDRTAARLSLGIGTGQLAVGVVANLRPMKGHLDLLRAFATLKVTYPQVHLFFAGEGPCRREISETAIQLGIADQVHLLGLRTDIPSILAAMDVFVLPSHWEGMPGSVMEAMAAGLPVIGTSVGGIPELIVDGVTGYLVQPGDSAVLGDRLAALFADHRHREALGRAAAERIKEHFSLNRMVRATESMYYQLVGRHE